MPLGIFWPNFIFLAFNNRVTKNMKRQIEVFTVLGDTFSGFCFFALRGDPNLHKANWEHCLPRHWSTLMFTLFQSKGTSMLNDHLLRKMIEKRHVGVKLLDQAVQGLSLEKNRLIHYVMRHCGYRIYSISVTSYVQICLVHIRA